MMIVFIVIELLFILFFFELPAVHEEEEEAEEKDSIQKTDKTSSQAHIDTDGRCSTATDGHLSCQQPERTPDHSDASSDCSVTATTIQIDGSRSAPQDRSKTDTSKDPLDSSCKLKDEDYFGGKVDEDERTPLLAECGPLSGQSVNSHHDEGVPHSTGSYGSVHSGSNEETAVSATTAATGETCCEKVGRLRQHVWWLISEFTREQIIVLLAVLFVTMFDQTAIEVRASVGGRRVLASNPGSHPAFHRLQSTNSWMRACMGSRLVVSGSPDIDSYIAGNVGTVG